MFCSLRITFGFCEESDLRKRISNLLPPRDRKGVASRGQWIVGHVGTGTTDTREGKSKQTGDLSCVPFHCHYCNIYSDTGYLFIANTLRPTISRSTSYFPLLQGPL